jgi:deoxynucleoside kinase|tara:strand:- start:1 stop:675 length:675 start_codon:yes stop_codon:yes gene_type:complete
MPFIVSIEGNIGSGKSTFIKYLNKYAKTNVDCIHRDIKYIQEPVDEWNNIKDSGGESILQKFYSNQEEYAFSFQIMAYITRLRKIIESIDQFPNAIHICERSLETDKHVFAQMLYDDKKIKEIDWVIYNYWFSTFLDKCKTNLIIYVNTTPENCHARVKLRDRLGESNIPLTYLQNCHTYHEKWIRHTKVNTLVLNGNTDVQDKQSYTIVLENTLNAILHASHS